MLKLVKELFTLLSDKQRKQLYLLQVLVVLMSFAEIVGVASIAPFMALVGDMSMIERKNALATLYGYSGFSSPMQFTFWLGVGVLVTLTISALISMYTTWRLSVFGSHVGTQIGDRLYAHYMNQSWLFHASGSSAQLIKQVTTDSSRVTAETINPVLQINAKITLATFMSIAIFIYDPIVASMGLILFGVAYFVLYKIVRNRLHNNGRIFSKESTIRFELMNEGFGGIKDILILGRSENFIKRFCSSGNKLARSIAVNQAISQLPRYFMELVAFGSMIALILYLLKTHHGDLSMVLPILSVYALAGFKLLPAFQLIYSNIANIRGSMAAFESIRIDLKNSRNDSNTSKIVQATEQLNLTKSIKLENITFTYPEKNESALKNLTMHVYANSIVGIVGSSGSGKSTAIDIILGLIKPQYGELLIDGKKIDDTNMRVWQNSIGFVSQSIFLSEGTISENVAFGIPKDEIDIQKVNKALSLAHLQEFILDLPEGIDTRVGERGVQLSGGQRQRVGIARALYNDNSVLVFDEATSALDGITEKIIMDAIHDFDGKKTIIMIAHRLKTVKKCSKIFFIDKGHLIDSGTYDELIQNNEHFKKMATHA